jgi:hypothetical protein
MPSRSDPNDRAPILDPEDVNSPANPPNAPRSVSGAASVDPNDEIPVPVAMSPAEIDERAQAVEALRGRAEPRQDDAPLDG